MRKDNNVQVSVKKKNYSVKLLGKFLNIYSQFLYFTLSRTGCKYMARQLWAMGSQFEHRCATP